MKLRMRTQDNQLHGLIRFVCWKLCVLLVVLAGCGRAPSSLLRQGQLPVYDFPLYVTEKWTGNVYRYERTGERRLVTSGLDLPQGIATDKWNNLYVVETGSSNRLVKINVHTGEVSVARAALAGPTTVAVNSFGEVYVNQEGANNIIRARDGKVFASYSSAPVAFFFGVNDVLISCLFSENRVNWLSNQVSANESASNPVGVAVDGMGRVFVLDGSANARMLRFNQIGGGSKILAIELSDGPIGLAVDPVGNIYFTESATGKITIIALDGYFRNFATGLSIPQYLAFTQY